jgi:hypothetical protein
MRQPTFSQAIQGLFACAIFPHSITCLYYSQRYILVHRYSHEVGAPANLPPQYPTIQPSPMIPSLCFFSIWTRSSLFCFWGNKKCGICIVHTLSDPTLEDGDSTVHQGSFFRLQNMEGLTLVGLFTEGTTLTCLEINSDAKKRTLLYTVWQSLIYYRSS